MTNCQFKNALMVTDSMPEYTKISAVSEIQMCHIIFSIHFLISYQFLALYINIQYIVYNFQIAFGLHLSQPFHTYGFLEHLLFIVCKKALTCEQQSIFLSNKYLAIIIKRLFF